MSESNQNRVRIYIGMGKERVHTLELNNLSNEIQEVLLIPKQDVFGIYQWVDVYEIDSITNQITKDLLKTARLIPGQGIVKTDRESIEWEGPGKQSLWDYKEGRLSSDKLLPIELTMGKSLTYLGIYSKGKERVYIVPPIKAGIKPGDRLVLAPERVGDDRVYYILTKDGEFIRRYYFSVSESGFMSVTNDSEILRAKEFKTTARTTEAIWGKEIMQEYASYMDDGGKSSFEEFVRGIR